MQDFYCLRKNPEAISGISLRRRKKMSCIFVIHQRNIISLFI